MKELIGKIDPKNIKVFESERAFELGDLGIYPFKIFHDAAEPVGFSIYYKKLKFPL